MLREERQNDPIADLELAMDSAKGDIRVAVPGIIQSFDPTASTVCVQPAVREFIKQANGDSHETALPLLVDVPVVFPRGGPFTLTFPINCGDECLVIFGDRCIDGWWQSGGVQGQVEARVHDLSDAFALVGPFSQATKLSGISTENLQLRHNDGDCYIEITPGKHVEVKAATMTLDIAGLLTIKAAHLTGASQ